MDTLSQIREATLGTAHKTAHILALSLRLSHFLSHSSMSALPSFALIFFALPSSILDAPHLFLWFFLNRSIHSEWRCIGQKDLCTQSWQAPKSSTPFRDNCCASPGLQTCTAVLTRGEGGEEFAVAETQFQNDARDGLLSMLCAFWKTRALRGALVSLIETG